MFDYRYPMWVIIITLFQADIWIGNNIIIAEHYNKGIVGMEIITELIVWST